MFKKLKLTFKKLAEYLKIHKKSLIKINAEKITSSIQKVEMKVEKLKNQRVV